MKRWSAAFLALALLLSQTATAAEYATITGGWLRLRSQPAYDSQTVASYYTGTKVEVLGASGEWYHVRLSDGNTGYMHRDYLVSATPGGSIQAENELPAAEGIPATVVSSNGNGVRLRTGPGTQYRMLELLPVGSPVTVLESGIYWSKVSVSGHTGYLMSHFLSPLESIDTGTPESYLGDATIWTGNGYGVRLRTGPGTEHENIGLYGVGTEVKLITQGAGWDYVQVGSRRGYMMNGFLLYNDHYTVTGVTINNQRPVLGNVLAVQSITPATATVTYEWLVKTSDGKETVKGTSAAYLVTEADVGAQIRLRITGSGRYKGIATGEPTQPVVRTGALEALTLNTLSPYVGDVLKPVTTPEDATVTYHWSINGETVSDAATYTVTGADVGQTLVLTAEGKHPYSGKCTLSTQPVSAAQAPQISTETLPGGSFHQSYNARLQATGGGQLQWSLVKGSLPVGLSMDQAGAITGTPAECGTRAFTVQVSSSLGTAEKELRLTVQKAQVSLPLIEDVPAPVAGGTAAASITPTEQYTGTVTWTPEPDEGIFAPSTAYTAVISLSAKPNHTFTGLSPSYFTAPGTNGASCTIGTGGDTAVVTLSYPATASDGLAQLPKPTITGIAKEDGAWIIRWSAVENAVGYRLRMPGGSWIDLSENSYAPEGIPASGSYQVVAAGDGEACADSDIADYLFTLPSPAPLAAPAGVSLRQEGESWLLCWQPVTGAIGYSVGKVGEEAVNAAAEAVTFTLAQPPEPGEAYQVVALGDGTDHTDSPAATCTYTQPAEKLEAPTDFRIYEENGTWKAAWSRTPNATGYRLGDSLGNWYACTRPSFVFATVPANGIYHVYALGDGTAYTDSDTTQLSYAAEGETAPERLPAPTGFRIEQSKGKWVAVWDEVPNATGYRFRQVGEQWVDCSKTRYTFSQKPDKTTFFLYAVGDGLTWLDSPEIGIIHQ